PARRSSSREPGLSLADRATLSVRPGDLRWLAIGHRHRAVGLLDEEHLIGGRRRVFLAVIARRALPRADDDLGAALDLALVQHVEVAPLGADLVGSAEIGQFAARLLKCPVGARGGRALRRRVRGAEGAIYGDGLLCGEHLALAQVALAGRADRKDGRRV